MCDGTLPLRGQVALRAWWFAIAVLVCSALAMPNCDGQCCNCKAKWRCERGNSLRQDGHHVVVVVVFRWGRAAGDSISSVLGLCKWCCFVLLRVLSCQMHGCHSGVCRNMRVLVAASHLDLTHVVDLHFSHMGLALLIEGKALGKRDLGGWILQKLYVRIADDPPNLPKRLPKAALQPQSRDFADFDSLGGGLGKFFGRSSRNFRGFRANFRGLEGATGTDKRESLCTLTLLFLKSCTIVAVSILVVSCINITDQKRQQLSTISWNNDMSLERTKIHKHSQIEW